MYRLFTTDLLSGRKLTHELPAIVDSYSHEISTPKTLEATLYADGTDEHLRSLTFPRRTACWLLRNEHPVWGGIIWQTVPDIAARTVRISAKGFLSYLDRIRIDQNITYPQWDQVHIAHHLVNWALTREINAGVPLHNPKPKATGKLRDRTYLGHELKPVLEALTQLSEVIEGFEFTEDTVTLDDGRLAGALRIGYPTIGRPDAGVLLEYPGNIEAYSWDLNGAESVNRMYAIGATPDGQQTPLITHATASHELEAGYPLLVDSRSYTDVSQQWTLAGHAWSDLRAAAGDHVAPTLTIRDDVMGSVQLGDVVRVRLDSWWHRPAAGRGPGLDESMRIVKIETRPDQLNGDLHTLTMEDLRQ